MHHHAAGLVDDRDVRILIEDVKRDILRGDVDGLCFGHTEHEHLPLRKFEGGLQDFTPVDGQRPAADQLRHARAGQLRVAGKIRVHARPVLAGLYGQFELVIHALQMGRACR